MKDTIKKEFEKLADKKELSKDEIEFAEMFETINVSQVGCILAFYAGFMARERMLKEAVK